VIVPAVAERAVAIVLAAVTVQTAATHAILRPAWGEPSDEPDSAGVEGPVQVRVSVEAAPAVKVATPAKPVLVPTVAVVGDVDAHVQVSSTVCNNYKSKR
jgi:hypothetical protein